MKTDLQLKNDVQAELNWEPMVDAATVGVEVKDGIVTLAGHLGSYAEKLAAERAAFRVSGVKGVAVEIDIKLPHGSVRTDGELAKAAVDALFWNAVVPKDRIKIKVEGGWITMTGHLDWAYQRKAAETAIRHLIGVKGVSNLVEIKTTVAPANVKAKIEAALERSMRQEAKEVRVSVDGSKVVLNGEVHSQHDRRLIEDAAWAAPGVTAVVDQLSIH
jgi:osmotically-inducible protein OsmY